MSAARMASVAALLGTVLLLAVGDAEAQGSGCQQLSAAAVVTAPMLLRNCNLEIAGPLVVRAGGSLQIVDSVLSFNAAQGTNVTIEGGGSLRMEASTIRAVNETLLGITFRAGSSGDVAGSNLTRYTSLLVASDAVSFRGSTLEGRSRGLVVDNGTSLTLVDVTISGQTAVRLEGGAEARLVNSTAAGASVVGPEARLRLEGTPRGSISVNETGRLSVGWFVGARVGAPSDLPVRLTLRDGNGNLSHDLTVAPNQNARHWVLLPVEERRGAHAEIYPEHRIVAVQQKNATHAPLRNLSANVAVDLAVPLDVDHVPPAWPGQAALTHVTSRAWQGNGARLTYTQGSGVNLTWPPANDTREMLHPHRAVDHYRIVVDDAVVMPRLHATQATLTLLPPGWRQVRVEAVDLVGNVAALETIEILVDPSPPRIQISLAPEAKAGSGAYAEPVNATVRVEDAGAPAAGLSEFRWRIGEGPFTRLAVRGSGHLGAQDAIEHVHLVTPGAHVLHVVAQDLAGNVAEAWRTIVVDTAPPVFDAWLEPRVSPEAWHQEAPTMHVAFRDPGPSGPGAVRWRYGDAAWQAYESPVRLDAVGEHLVHVEAFDGAGNVARSTIRLAHDPLPPVLDVHVLGDVGESGWYTEPVLLQATGADGISGLARLEHRLASGSWRPMDQPVTLGRSGEQEVTVRATDAAGHNTSRTLTLRLDLEAPLLPQVEWISLHDGRIVADWSRSPPMDGASGIAAVVLERASLDGRLLESRIVDPQTRDLALSGLPRGDHRLRFVVADVAGYSAKTPWITVRGGEAVDLTALGTAVHYARGEISIAPSPEMADHVLREVRYYADGMLQAVATTRPYAMAWDTATVQNGRHEIRIVAVDEAGVHHEEIRLYNVRNGYVAAVVDDLLPFLAALAVAATGVVVSLRGRGRWRKHLAALASEAKQGPQRSLKLYALKTRGLRHARAQTALALVFLLLAALAVVVPASPVERAAFVRAWWTFAGIALAALAAPVWSGKQLASHQRAMALPEPWKPSPTQKPIDFDRVWKNHQEDRR